MSSPTAGKGYERPRSFPRAPYYYGGGQNSGPPVPGSVPVRKNVRRTVYLPTSGAEVTGYFDLEAEAGADLLQFSCSQPCRIVLYATEDDRDDDADRDEEDLPTTTVLLDIRFGATTETQSYRLFDQGIDGVHILNRDDPAKTRIYYRIIPDDTYFESGFLVMRFPKSNAALWVLADDGQDADSCYGLTYTLAANSNPYSRIQDGVASHGWDNYWASWGFSGLRARTATGPARFWGDPSGNVISQTSSCRHSPLGGVVDSDWAHFHTYFQSGYASLNGTLQIGLNRSGVHFGTPVIQWTDNTGHVTVLDDDTAVSVLSDTRLISQIDGNVAKLWVNGSLVCTATIPNALITSGRKGVGLFLYSNIVSLATRAYGGLAVDDWGVKDGEFFPVVMDLGYVPTERPGGSIRRGSVSTLGTDFT